jgi:hypothetical protein
MGLSARSTPAGTRVRNYAPPVPVYNTSGDDAAAGSALEVVGYDVAKQRINVRRPSRNGLNPAQVLFARGRIRGQSDGTANASFPERARFDPTYGNPATGEAWGTKADTFDLHLGYFGFRAIAGAMRTNYALFVPDTSCVPEPSNSSGSGSASSYNAPYSCDNLPPAVVVEITGLSATWDGVYTLVQGTCCTLVPPGVTTYCICPPPISQCDCPLTPCWASIFWTPPCNTTDSIALAVKPTRPVVPATVSKSPADVASWSPFYFEYDDVGNGSGLYEIDCTARATFAIGPGVTITVTLP